MEAVLAQFEACEELLVSSEGPARVWRGRGRALVCVLLPLAHPALPPQRGPLLPVLRGEPRQPVLPDDVIQPHKAFQDEAIPEEYVRS